MTCMLYFVCLYCSSFKLFLELEPQLREIVYKLHDSKYASSLKLLDEMKVCTALLFSLLLLSSGLLSMLTSFPFIDNMRIVSSVL